MWLPERIGGREGEGPETGEEMEEWGILKRGKREK